MTFRKPRSARHRARSRPAPRASRGADRTVWIYGRHAVAAALANPRRRRRRLVATEEALAALARECGAPFPPPGLAPETPPRGDFEAALPRNALPPGAVHQGLALAVEPLDSPTLDDVCATPATDEHTGERTVVVVLDQVTDPQNMGACLRAAAAFGARAVIVPDRHSPRESGALARAASGALDIVPLVRVANLARALDRLQRLGYWCLGLDGAAEATIEAALPGGPIALVLGAEGAGLRRLTRARCDGLARLPISDAVESLNVAAATAVALYAATRSG